MKLQELLTSLQHHQVKIYLDQGMLKTQAPAGAITSELAAQIRLHKEDLLQLLQQTASRQTTPAIARQSRAGALLLSYGQERLWMIDQLQGGSPEYNMQFILRITGDFVVDVAEQVLSEIVQRHEILRTTYHSDDSGMPLQRIEKAGGVSIRQIELTVPEGQDADSCLAALAADIASQVFDLSRDLMLKVTYVKTAARAGQGYLLLTMHHIAADGWSMAILQREFVRIYQSKVTGSSPELADLAVQYADYAHWQRQMQAQPEYQQQLAYWVKQLADIPPVHGLLLDYQRPAVKQYQGAMLQNRFSPALSTKLVSLAREHGLTHFMLMHALFAVVLSSHSNQHDIVIGIPQTNRPKPELNALVGFFINTLVLRANTDQATVTDLFSHIRQVHTEAQANSDVPFEQLADLLQAPRTTAHTPVFQIMLTADADYSANLLGSPDGDTTSVQISPMGGGPIQAKFDLNLDYRVDDDGMTVSWIYDINLFSAARIQQMSQHLQQLAEQLANTGNLMALPMSELQLLSADEIAEQLQHWNPPAAGHRADVLLHQLFLQQAELVPEQIALIDEDGELSYGELFDAARGLCEVLWQHQLKLGERVAIRLPKGRYQVISALAVLMAGGVYLPMETNWPAARCEKICQKAACHLLLVLSPEHELDWPGGKNLPILSLLNTVTQQQLPVLVASHSDYLQQQPTDLAYIIFTSGSTGEPKGVEIEHHSAMNTVLEMIQYYQLSKADRVLAVSALSFDLSVFDIFGLLAVGGTVVFPTAALATDPAHWLAMVEQHQVTVWDTVPAAAALLADQLEYLERSCQTTVRHVLLSGDWIAPALPARLWRLLPGCQVHSLGGATEAAIWSIHYPITEDPTGWKSVPYGRPMAGQSFYILGHRQQLLPAGVTGELYIGGRGVARGYCADETLTNRQFIWHQGLAKRLYRTGDLGRYLPDGVIEFVGRADQQVKIRGFRIELGEIEVVLNQQATVDSCLVVANKQGGADQLVAYLKLTTGAEQVATELITLKNELAKQLPPYMVPSALVPVERWPLTANGKICKKSLPPANVISAATMRVAAVTDTEIQLATLWAELLAVPNEQLSITTDFFAAGGHSLLLIKLMVGLRRLFQVELKMQDLLSHQTIEQQAVLIDSARYFSRLAQHTPLQDPAIIEVTL